MSWRLRELGRETLLNLGPGHVLLALLIGAGAWLGTAPDVATVDRTITSFQRRIEAGDAVWVVESERGFDAGRCELLSASVSSIRASGAILADPSRDTVRFLQSPDVEYPVLDVTPGLVEVATGDHLSPLRGVIVGSGITDELGVAPGVVLRTTTGVTLPLVRVVDTDVRDLGFGRDVLAVTAPDRAAYACWFETEPWAPETTPELAQGLIAPSDPRAVLSPYATVPVTAAAVVSELRERTTRNVVGMTSGLLLVIAMGWVLLRRRALTTYRVSGTSMSERVLILGGELALAMVAGWALAIAALASTAETPESFAAGLWAVTVAAPSATLGGVTMIILLGLRRIDRALRD